MSYYKKYHEYMNDITADEIYEGLLGYGLFSEKLPPVFSSKSFYEFCSSNSVSFKKEPTNYVFYENIRNINLPRPLGIPNPMSYHFLCNSIRENWFNIQNHFEEQTLNQEHKISRIHIRKMKDTNQLFQMNYSNWKIDSSPELDLLIGKKYVVSADISNCFPSMYSHSLFWSLVGKDVAKANKNSKNVWYNDIDLYTRNTKNGETQGVLIGPHASNLLSEIILVCVDKVLYDKGFKFIRNIDDYTLYEETYEKCQDFLIQLSSALRKFNLTLNHKKTKISELPNACVEQWVRKLNSLIDCTNKELLNYKDVQRYIDLSIDLMTENNYNAAILNYCIKVISKKKLSINAKDYLFKTMSHLCIIYPYIIPLLEEHIFDSCDVSSESIQQIAQLIFDSNLKTKNYEGVSFAIYYSIKYEFLLDGVSFENVKECNNAVCLLLAYLYASKNNIKTDKKEYKNLAEELAGDNETFDLFWVFVYECLPKTKLKDNWKCLKNNNISFVTL